MYIRIYIVVNMDNRRTVQLLCLCVAVTLLTSGVVSRDVASAISPSTLAGVTAATHRRFSTNCVFLIYVEGQMGECAGPLYIFVHIKLCKGSNVFQGFFLKRAPKGSG